MLFVTLLFWFCGSSVSRVGRDELGSIRQIIGHQRRERRKKKKRGKNCSGKLGKGKLNVE